MSDIYRRINAIMKDVVGVAKTDRNAHAKYNYAGHEAVTAALRSAYVKHGVVRHATVDECIREGGLLRLGVVVAFINIDDPTDRIELTMFAEAPSTTSKGGATPQQAGVALSYAVKNAEFKLFSLTGDDTPDAEEYHERYTPEPQARFEDLASMMSRASSSQEIAVVVKAIQKSASALSDDERTTLRGMLAEAKERAK
jgi:hypothetical protein